MVANTGKRGRKDPRNLNFDCLPIIDKQDILIRLSCEIEKKFSEFDFLSETRERAQSALMFFFQTKEEDARWRNDARLRAGLNEFYALADAAKRDFRKAPMPVAPPCIAESQSPLVHMMYCLRHVNVHTEPTPTKVQPITVSWVLDGTNHDHTYGAVMLDNVTIDDLKRSHEVSTHYRNEDLERSLDWLQETQQTFGISELFRAGVNTYCSEIFRSLTPHLRESDVNRV